MPRFLRLYLIACIGVAFAYLVRHAGEPLRLNIGDPWGDAAVVSSVGAWLGTTDVAVFRALAIIVSMFGAWLLYQYLRRMWTDTVAVIATALATTSLLWLMFADGIARAPMMHAACFLALWGSARALETGHRRHHAAALIGTFVCLFTATDDWLFLPLGLVFTVLVKRGERRRVVVMCAAGALLALILRAVFVSAPAGWQTSLDHRVAATLPTVARRFAALLTPMIWITFAVAVWRALRAPSVRAAIEDGTTWMLVGAAAAAYLPASGVPRVQVWLPFYAIGSALLIARLFEGGWIRRSLATAWCVAGPVWGLWLMWSHPREVLERDDVAMVNDYFAAHDRLDFVMSNLLADGPLVAAFGRHGWSAPDRADTSETHLQMLAIFEAAGTDYVHAVIFKTPGSRFVDRSIAQLMPRRMAAVDGWPYLIRAKVDAIIDGYDRRVRANLEAVGAQRVLELHNFDLYRIDRTAMLDTVAKSRPIVRVLDFAGLGVLRHQLLGWGDQLPPAEPATIGSSIAGYHRCGNPIVADTTPAPNGCTVVPTATGLGAVDPEGIVRASLLVRVDRSCDQQVTIALAEPARIDVAWNGVAVLACGDPDPGTTSLSVRVPRGAVRAGANVISVEDARPEEPKQRLVVKSVAIDPICEAAP